MAQPSLDPSVQTPEPIMDDDMESEHEGAAGTDRALDDRGSLTPEFIRAVNDAIDHEDPDEIISRCEDLKAADMADLLEQLSDAARARLLAFLGDNFDPEILAELEDGVRDAVLEALPTEQLASAITELDTDEAAFVVQDLDEEGRAEILAEMPIADRLALEAALDYPEETAGRLMQREVFAAPSFSTVGQVIDRLRSGQVLPDLFYDVYVVDPAFKVVGGVTLSRFLKAPRETKLIDMVERDLVTIPVAMDQEEVAYLFEKYNLISAPVVDDGDRLVGMVTVDDVVEVLHTEADEDMLSLAGVNAEGGGLSQPVPIVARSRFVWLLINLGTAILASFVISFFDATITEVVALAILMPIVASMGGNAGTQTLTVAVRNLATRDLTSSNMIRVIMRETAVSMINGVAFAVLLGIAAGLWYEMLGGGASGDGMTLGFVLATAMIITMLAAGLSGILIPIGLERAGADPAVASAVFVTTVTDVVGFFAFLGLAAVFLVG